MSALGEVVQRLVFEFGLRTGMQANMILVPKRKDHVKLFAEGLAEDTPEAGSAPFIFDQLWRLERPCKFMGLEVYISNEVDDLTVDFDLNQLAEAANEAPAAIN